MKTRSCGLDRADTVFLAAFTVPGKTYFLVQLGRILRIPKASTDPLKTAEDQKRSLPLLKIWLSSLISVSRFSLTSEKNEATDGFDKISQHLDFF